ncbi:MAG: MFS transporter [Dehalococcoidia bacterium]
MIRRFLPRVYEGWLVAVSGSLVIVVTAAAFFHGFGTVFNPIREEIGISVTATALAFSLRSQTGGFAAPLVGLALDRVGARLVLLSGLAIAAGGLFALSFIQNLWQFYVAMMIIAVGASGAGGVAGYKATSTWFEKRRARALAVVSVGGSFSGLLVIGVGFLVEEMGWRSALRIMAILVLVLVIVPALNIRERPARHAQPMDGFPRADNEESFPEPSPLWGVPVRQAIRSRSFLLLVLGFALVGFGSTALQVHLIPFVESLGYSTSVASTTVAVFTFTTLFGRVGGGLLADIHDKRTVIALSTVIVAAGLPILAFATQLWQVFAALMIIGVGFGGTIPVRQAILADYYGAKHFGTMNGLMMLSVTFGSIFGPLVVGRAVDVTNGDYTIGWLASSAVVASAILLLWAARPQQELISTYGPRPPD